VYDTLLAYVRQRGRIALATAASGIAAQLLPGGTTAHARFKIPVKKLEDTSSCNLSKSEPPTGMVEVILLAGLILIDEAPMMHKYCFSALDRTLRDLCGVDKLFGGKVLVIGGDFRQTLPVVRHGQAAECVDACLKRWDRWQCFKVLKLTENVRVRNALALGGGERAAQLRDYAAWLLDMGDGKLPTFPAEGEMPQENDNAVRLPEGTALPEDLSIEDLIRVAYGDGSTVFSSTTAEFLASRTVLSPRNKDVDEVNQAALELFPTQGPDTPSSPSVRLYYSADSIKEASEDQDRSSAAKPKAGMNNQDLYPLEFLNSITAGSLPPHQLHLKKGCIVMLLRNLNPREGLANGTRVVVKNMYSHLVEVQIVAGPHAGKVALIPRITCKCEEDLPFTLYRRQFPLKLAFAMTVNKSQGQTLQNVVLYLPFPVFSHGQLYTAFSRVGDPSCIKVLARGGRRQDGSTYTSNVVHHHVVGENE
jgi:ATP-dependent DNA helicase PIF1